MIRIENMFNPSLGETVSPTDFPDGTKLLKFTPAYGADYRIVWLYDNDEELFQLIALVKHIKSKGCKVWLTLPYVPNARMDRTKNEDEVFTLKAFAETINWLGFERVTICNPHSTVSEALFDRVEVDFNCVVQDVASVIRSAENIDVIYFPDEGACKRYSDLLSFLKLPVAFGIKKRDWQTGKILGIDIVGYDDLKGKNVLMVDDICAYGGTFYYSACALKDKGANEISCYVTHLEKSVMDVQKGKLIQGDLIKRIYATNSIFRVPAGPSKVHIVRKF